ncbi:hypothetical protein GT901_23970 [Vibrio parahaemolyticus]|nr:hypothetical protein [Vibrio parahaemolyticus]EGQ8942688.1 hypothetical protein [Vibrio parahaemolyticus]EGQ8952417.1 hypothetical protein [Vibrio parahaemolyticus]EGQ8972339.1 hypothetical protein [Vibrio parahaemolyticus]EGR3244711.1 hypothetical protein [Vibrio parahaemolyticus]
MNRLNRALVVISFVCLFLVLKTSDEPVVFEGELSQFFFGQFSQGNSILFNLTSGLLISIWFYFLVVFVPDFQKKQRVKKHFIMQYYEFRKQVIAHILETCQESYDSELLMELINPNEFKTYFDEKIEPSKTRWHVFINNADSTVIQSILSEFIAFKEATLYLLSKMDIENENVHSFLHNFNTITTVLVNTSVDDYDSMKVFSSYLRDVFAGFNFSTGVRKYDYFEKMFEKI